MDNNEIVRATRALAVSRDNQCDNDFVLMAGKKVVLNTAAGLIESLQAQLTEKDLEMEVLEGRAENQREYLMSLRRQLIASTHREKAAVNFIKYLDRNYSGYMAEDEKFEQWRCPQEVEKGETNA